MLGSQQEGEKGNLKLHSSVAEEEGKTSKLVFADELAVDEVDRVLEGL